jgi:membrane protease YdiL (CAAX protease family)
MSKSKWPPLRRLRLDGRAWLALLAFGLFWFVALRAWPLVGREAAQLLGRWVHPGAAARLSPGAGGLFGGMALEDIGSRFGLYALETAVVGLIGWLGLAMIARERPLRLLTDAPRFRLGLALFGLIACAGAVLAQRLIQTGGKIDLGWGVGSILAQAMWAACLLVLTLTVGFFEEAIFRGGLLRLSPQWAWLVPFALMVNAGLFAGVHGAQSPVEFVDRFALGMALGYATLRLRGIELAVGLHAGFDFAAMLLHPGQLEHAPWTIAAPVAKAQIAAPGLPWQVELTAGAAMAVIFSVVAILLTELVVRAARVLGLGRRERVSVKTPAAWVLDEPEPVQV